MFSYDHLMNNLLIKSIFNILNLKLMLVYINYHHLILLLHSFVNFNNLKDMKFRMNSYFKNHFHNYLI